MNAREKFKQQIKENLRQKLQFNKLDLEIMSSFNDWLAEFADEQPADRLVIFEREFEKEFEKIIGAVALKYNLEFPEVEENGR